LQLNGGISVAAKTGTAQLNAEGEKQRSHAWITAFAPVEAPRFVVSVFIKGVSASTGGRLAGPVARDVLNAALALPAAP
jgi:cell division protein FtsI/penicillin-binding protein 2